MNIDYTIDLDGFGFIKSVSNYTSLRDHRLTHRDKLSLKVRFTRAGVAQNVGALVAHDVALGTGTRFTVKKLNEDEEVLSDDSTAITWTQGGTAPDVYYTHDGLINLDTAQLDALMGQSASAQADVQFRWQIGDQLYRSRLLKTTIDRALLPATIPPTIANDPSRSYVTMLQNVNQIQGDVLPVSGAVDLQSVVTVGLQVPRWVSFVRAEDGILYYYQLRAGTDAASVYPAIDIIRPTDYAAGTNEKVFDFQVIAYSGGTNLTDSATDTTVTVISDVGTDAVLVAPTPQAAGILVASERGVVALAQSALSGSVSFSAAFDSAPQHVSFTVKMSSAAGSPVSTSSVIFAVSYAVTASGFKYWLSGPPDDGDHELHWWAIL